jgi:hypothetical protein
VILCGVQCGGVCMCFYRVRFRQIAGEPRSLRALALLNLLLFQLYAHLNLLDIVLLASRKTLAPWF